MCLLVGAIIGGALVFVYPKVATGGNAIFKYLKKLAGK